MNPYRKSKMIFSRNSKLLFLSTCSVQNTSRTRDFLKILKRLFQLRTRRYNTKVAPFTLNWFIWYRKWYALEIEQINYMFGWIWSSTDWFTRFLWIISFISLITCRTTKNSSKLGDLKKICITKNMGTPVKIDNTRNHQWSKICRLLGF